VPPPQIGFVPQLSPPPPPAPGPRPPTPGPASEARPPLC
jgi:hypothetical protein